MTTSCFPVYGRIYGVVGIVKNGCYKIYKDLNSFYKHKKYYYSGDQDEYMSIYESYVPLRTYNDNTDRENMDRDNMDRNSSDSDSDKSITPYYDRYDNDTYVPAFLMEHSTTSLVNQ